MNIQDFCKDFSKLFDETDPSIFIPDLNFKELDEWNSLIALSFIVMCDDDYGKKITASDIRNSITISDLFNILKSN